MGQCRLCEHSGGVLWHYSAPHQSHYSRHCSLRPKTARQWATIQAHSGRYLCLLYIKYINSNILLFYDIMWVDLGDEVVIEWYCLPSSFAVCEPGQTSAKVLTTGYISHRPYRANVSLLCTMYALGYISHRSRANVRLQW